MLRLSAYDADLGKHPLFRTPAGPPLAENGFLSDRRILAFSGGAIIADHEITIHNGMIDVSEIPMYPPIEWEPILNELKAEHIPGLYQQGKRMGVSIVNGTICAYIYLTDKTPPESEILEILKRHGVT